MKMTTLVINVEKGKNKARCLVMSYERLLVPLFFDKFHVLQLIRSRECSQAHGVGLLL